MLLYSETGKGGHMCSFIRLIVTTLLITTMVACSGGGGGGSGNTGGSVSSTPADSTTPADTAAPGATNDTGVAGTTSPSTEKPPTTEKPSDATNDTESAGATQQKPGTDGTANSPGGDGGAQAPGVINDTSGLTVGSDIIVDFKDSAYVSFSWGAAKDTATPEADLQYKVVLANKPDTIDTVAEANTVTDKGLIHDWEAASKWNGNLKDNAFLAPDGSKLTPGATYYVTVLVRDADNNMALYSPQPIATLPLPSSPQPAGQPTFSNVSPTGITVSWKAATDDVTPSDKLSYKLVTSSNLNLIDSIAKVEAVTGPGLIMDWATNTLSKSLVDLEPGRSYSFAVIVKDTDGNMALYYPTSQVTKAVKLVFTTSALLPNFGGISAADDKCAAATNKPANGGTFKAMIVDGETRIACTSSNCGTDGIAEHKDWVFAPNTAYARTDNEIVGTTNDKGIFDFPLSSNIVDFPNYVWTGLSTNWTTSADTCLKWTNSDVDKFGTYGSYQSAAGAISAGTFACFKSTIAGLLCVEQ